MTDSDEDDIMTRLDIMEDKHLLGDREMNSEGRSNAVGKVKEQLPCFGEYPGSIIFIIGNEFCERFSYYGMRTILVLYLTQWLMFDDTSAVAIYHSFTVLCYFMPILGAILADGYIGKYRTILYISFVYALGNIVMATTAFPPAEVYGPMIGLLLIGIGTGGIKPCVSAFGGDQFSKGQEKNIATYFSMFYFAINAGSLISTFLTPILRADVHCIGDSCYPLAFGIPAILMLVALGIFVAGRSRYKIIPPMGNLIGQVFRATCRALKQKCKSPEKKDHWLEYAEDKFEPALIEDMKVLYRVLFMFLPLPVFWALFDQQGSRWTLQAETLDGHAGVFGTIKPDQMTVVNPILILVFIPLFEKIIYPLATYCKIPNRPLQRMSLGMLLSAISFIIAGFLQIKIDSTLVPSPLSVKSGVTFLNSVPCPITMNSTAFAGTLDSMQSSNYSQVDNGALTINLPTSCQKPSEISQKSLLMEGGENFRLFVVQDASGTIDVLKYYDEVDKPKKGQAAVSIFSNLFTDGQSALKLSPSSSNKDGIIIFNFTRHNASSYQYIEPLKYNVSIQMGTSDWTQLNNTLQFLNGGIYTVLITVDKNNLRKAILTTITTFASNSLSIFYMIPQYTVLTAGEILFSITGLSFAYSQAPVSMKSVIQAAWLLTVAGGNVIVVIVAESQIVPSRMGELFLFAGLMVVMTVLFSIMAIFYVYVEPSTHTNELDDVSGLIVSEITDDESDKEK